MSFDEALSLFDEQFFDFIYFDGYAHTGEEGGKTFADWWPKLKTGGVYAGDDYHADWPLVKWAVNAFSQKVGAALQITGQIEKTNLNRYPSWFFTKNTNYSIAGLIGNQQLLDIGLQIRAQTRKKGIRHI
jgi:hypothetical protein